MKSAEEIYNTLSKDPNLPTFKELALAAMREYAAQAITEQLEVAAQEAEVKIAWSADLADSREFPVVDPESITSCTRIELP